MFGQCLQRLYHDLDIFRCNHSIRRFYGFGGRRRQLLFQSGCMTLVVSLAFPHSDFCISGRGEMETGVKVRTYGIVARHSRVAILGPCACFLARFAACCRWYSPRKIVIHDRTLCNATGIVTLKLMTCCEEVSLRAMDETETSVLD